MMIAKKFCLYCMSPMGEGEACPACGRMEKQDEPICPDCRPLPQGTVLSERYLVGHVLDFGKFISYIGCDMRQGEKVIIREYFPYHRVTRTASTSPKVICRGDWEVTTYENKSAADVYEEFKGVALQNAQAMAKLVGQPGIVRIRDSFEANNTVYIIMDYPEGIREGISLYKLVMQRGGRIPAKELLPLMKPVFSGLSAIHGVGLTHYNINPGSLWLINGKIWILDFLYDGELRENYGSEIFMVNQDYAPIEQYMKNRGGPKVDVYTLAGTMYYCLTCKVPSESMDRLMGDELIPPRKLGADLTEKQEQALLQAMAVKSKERTASVEAFKKGIYPSFVLPHFWKRS